MTSLEISALSVHFGRGPDTVRAVDRVDLVIPPGAVVGIVGESGSGKSTLARAVVGLVPATSGAISLDDTDLARLRSPARRARRRKVQMVFQDPYGSLNPRMTVGAALAEAVAAREGGDRATRQGEVRRLLELVELDERYARALPRELSGGQRQRVAIARALAVEPEVLIADEITSALDASVTGAILNLLRDLRERLGLSILFISHNLAVVRYVSDSIGVMYLGRLVEFASTDALVADPKHPYTRALLEAVPSLGNQRSLAPTVLDEEPPDPHAPPPGCHFHPRCGLGPLVRPERTECVSADPWPGGAVREHRAACHFAPGAAGVDAGINAAVDAGVVAP
jgi:peptide/nickel transport system ATP-binding protein